MQFSIQQEANFWAKVAILGPDDCWPWLASKGNPGYGHVCVNGQFIDSHRMSFMLTKGPIPKGLVVRHQCPQGERRDCCNPAHLILGTHRDNSHDAVRRGRARMKVDGAIVLDIASKKSHSPMERLQLALNHGVPIRYIEKVQTGKTLSAFTGIKPRSAFKGEDIQLSFELKGSGEC